MDAPVVGESLESIVARAEDLTRDVRLDAVRAWKGEHPGKKAIGYLPVYVPREIIHAAGMLPVGIMGGGDQVEIVKGDAYFQSYLCHLPRSTIELGLDGSLDVLDGMIFPSTCDVIRNLSGMWQMLFPEKYVRYFDVPQDFDDRVGGEFYERELRSLIDDLAGLGGGEKVTDEALRRSIALFNENRAHVRAIYAARVKTPWLVPTSEVYLLLRAGNVLPVEEHNSLLGQYLEAARASARRPMDLARVALRGTFCEQPPIDLVRTLERAGCCIVDDDWVLAARWPKDDVAVDGDPVKSLVSAFLHRSPECPSVYLAEGKKGEALVASVKACGAEGVIFAAPSFCDPALLDQPMTQAAAKAAGIPTSAFLYSENTGQFQSIREQAGTFADSIKLS